MFLENVWGPAIENIKTFSKVFEENFFTADMRFRIKNVTSAENLIFVFKRNSKVIK